jgi:hypothetical protein
VVKVYNLCRVSKTDISAVLTVKSGLDPHMINKHEDGLKSLFWLFLVALLSTNHKCTHPSLLLLRRRRCMKFSEDVAEF